MKDIHDIRPPVQIGFDPMLFKIVLMVLGGMILLALLFFLIKKGLKKRKQPESLRYLPEPLPPYESALKELDLLFQRQMDDPRLFYFGLTTILRQYIGRSFSINAIEMTSQEFIKGVNRLGLDKVVKKDIARFLKLSDPFKYAGIVPEKNCAKEDFLLIKAVIDQIENDLARQAKIEEEEEEN